MLQMRKFDFEEIKILAHTALSDILEHPVHQKRFFALTGITPEQIRKELNQPVFIGAILDYLMQDDGYLKEFADSVDLNPAAITLARLRLPGAPMQE